MNLISGLADELLLAIAQQIQPLPPVLERSPFSEWHLVIQTHNDEAIKQTKTLSRLARTCRELHRVLNPVVYAYIRLLRVAKGRKIFTRSILANTALASYVRHGSFHYAGSARFGTLLASLDGMHTLDVSMARVPPSSTQPPTMLETISCDKVKVLRLIHDGPADPTVAAILKLPKRLEELWYYGADVVRSGGHWSGRSFDSYAIGHAIKHHGQCLEKLVINYTYRITERSQTTWPLVPLDMRKLGRLRSLSVSHGVLYEIGHYSDIARHLPRTLEELEITFGDSRDVFLYSDNAWPESSGETDWLETILMQPRSRNDDYTLHHCSAFASCPRGIERHGRSRRD